MVTLPAQEIKNRILIHLDQHGPDDSSGSQKLSGDLGIDFERIIDCLYALEDQGFVILKGTDRTTVLAKITTEGRQLVAEGRQLVNDIKAKTVI